MCVCLHFYFLELNISNCYLKISALEINVNILHFSQEETFVVRGMVSLSPAQTLRYSSCLGLRIFAFVIEFENKAFFQNTQQTEDS